MGMSLPRSQLATTADSPAGPPAGDQAHTSDVGNAGWMRGGDAQARPASVSGQAGLLRVRADPVLKTAGAVSEQVKVTVDLSTRAKVIIESHRPVSGALGGDFDPRGMSAGSAVPESSSCPRL